MTTRQVTITIDGKSFTYEARLNKHKPPSFDVDLRLVYEGNELAEVRDRWASSENVTIRDGDTERPRRGNLLGATPTATAGSAPQNLLRMRTDAFMGKARPW